jgi:hypothetical protein
VFNQAEKGGSGRVSIGSAFFELLKPSRLVPLISKTPTTTCGFHERISKELWVCSFIIYSFFILKNLII